MSIHPFMENPMNNFPRPHTYNAYNTNNINDINNIKDNNPIVLSQNFHKENTSPLPVIPKIPTMPKVNYYPPEWDKKKTKLPPLSSILSNHHYVIVCVIFTSIILLVTMLKVIWLFVMK